MKILIGWELGGNQGHLTSIGQIAGRLRTWDHEIVVAVRPGSHIPPALAGYEIILAPRWSATHSASEPQAPLASMGDILAKAGLAEAGTMSRLISEWLAIFRCHKPDVVVADYSPALLRAARGRIYSIAVGTGFTCPPDGLGQFPILNPSGSHQPGEHLLAAVNRDLLDLDLRPLECCPEIFSADQILLATWPELDPYARHRVNELYVAPSTSSRLPAQPGANGDDVFVYTYATMPADSVFWQAVAAPGYPVRVHMTEATPEHISQFDRFNFSFERYAIGFDMVAASSRLVLSHGGHGTICSSLVSGIPVLTVSLDLEKRLNGMACEALGVGKCLHLGRLRGLTLATQIQDIYDDSHMMQRSLSVANRLRNYNIEKLEDAVARIVFISPR